MSHIAQVQKRGCWNELQAKCAAIIVIDGSLKDMQICANFRAEPQKK